ncbi:hypothetical protein FOQG_11393 [Fusarium oxysporum f. sp. raphani 54005]|uniref:Uncharacterized protein n=2 Tax=Fusarium oxysporum TaxID=5507 RepID=X0CQ07_FUSOX|nr:hypothetical protein FOQG_11393 [Fusarium oxysporum f. sp. raphani 54005]EXL71037.1 hypothetical protein FOPG_13156 [Fusarium oxysporum f. sp. conglutinans race 2 54008]
MSWTKICDDLAVSILVTGSLDWMGSQGYARRICKSKVMGSFVDIGPSVSILRALIKYDEMLSCRVPGSNAAMSIKEA